MVPLEPSPLTHLGLDFEALLDSSSLNPDCTADLTLLVRRASLLCTPRSHGQSPLYHKFQVSRLDPPLTPRLERSLSFSPFKYSIIHSGSRTLPPKKRWKFSSILNQRSSILNNSWYLAAQNLILCMLGFFLSSRECGNALHAVKTPPPSLSEGTVLMATLGRKSQVVLEDIQLLYNLQNALR